MSNHDKPIVGIGHPDPNHPTNKYKGDDAFIYDAEGRPVTSKGRWGNKGTDLWMFLLISKSAPALFEPARGFKQAEVCRKRMGGVCFTLGVSHGRPRFHSAVYGQSLELPSDLARDYLKKTYVIDWLKDTALENMAEAVANMNFTGLSSPGDFATWLEESADKTIGKMGL